jgi:hypothetical protein
VEEALKIDHEIGADYWIKAIEKEMKNNRITFEFLDADKHVPPGYKNICCYMNFEIRMDFTRKAHFVDSSHMTDPPTFMTYSSVVSHNSVQIGILIAALTYF